MVIINCYIIIYVYTFVYDSNKINNSNFGIVSASVIRPILFYFLFFIKSVYLTLDQN